MDKQKIIKVLKILTLIMLILFWIMFKTTSKTDCETCSFQWDDKEINLHQLLNIQSEECLTSTGGLWDNQEVNFSEWGIIS